MKVFHINTWGGIGGAFIASDRLHQGLLKSGITSILGYGKSLNGSDAVIRQLNNYKKLPQKKIKIENFLSKYTKKIGLNDIGNISSLFLKDEQDISNADIINLHNLHSDYFSYLALPNLTSDKPAIWTLHDMWSFTGHCAYSYDCFKWKTGCGQCPYPNTQPAIRRDATAWEWKLKDWIYSRSNLTIVTPSRWLCEQAKQSMLNRFAIHHIPNGIDTDAYQPLEQQLCRKVLGISQHKYVLMFGAQSLKQSRKGGDLLVEALALLPDSLKAETLLLTIGGGGEVMAKTVGIPHLSLDYVGSDRLKSVAYSAADLFLFPTRADNLPLVLQESMACGTPMVSFKVGGVPDLVRPNVTGYLAEAENPQDFCQGVVQLLEDAALRQRMSENCRAIALEEYPLELQAKRYIELYQTILAKSQSR
ncbi:MAG: glycosyltransferase [Cyanobacteria bacterium]|nr:glycosyltransferase [Cyanobacteria bacterium GSL.Bin21]